MSKTSVLNFSDFKWGRLDRRVIMRGGVNYRNNGFLDSNNVFFTNNNTVVHRPGTRLIKDFGTTYTRIFPFSKGQASQYIFAMQANSQDIYYVDQDYKLVLASTNDDNTVKIPEDLVSNSDQGYEITGGNGVKDYYKVFSTYGYDNTDINDITVIFPAPVQFFAFTLDAGTAAGFTVTITKADDTFFEVDARQYALTNRWELPSNYNYTNIKSIRIRAYWLEQTGGHYEPVWSAGGRVSGQKWVPEYTKRYTTPNANIQKLTVLGPATGESLAHFEEKLEPEVVKNCDWDTTNWYVFFAHHKITPYYLNIAGEFSFQKITPQFPTDYNFTTMGNPAHVCCAQSRLWFANMRLAGTSIIGSNIAYQVQTDTTKPDSFFNFKPTVIEGQALAPDSAVKFQPIEIKNPITWMVGGTSLGIGSWDGNFKLFYGQGGVISATGAAIKNQNSDAASYVKPAFWDGYCVFTGLSRDNLRLMDFNLYVDRQESKNISVFHTELLGRLVTKVIVQKDASNNLYVLFDDGTAAQLCLYSREDRGYFPFEVANAKIIDINTIKTDLGERLYLTCEYSNPATGEKTYKLVLMEQMDYPVYPESSLYDPESAEEVAEWVMEKCPLDFKQYIEHPLTFAVESPLYVSQIQTANPEGIAGIIENYGPYVRFLNNPINGLTWDELVGKTLFFEDSTTGWDYFIKIYKANDFIFGVPGRVADEHWTNNVLEQDGITYAVSGTTGFIGIEEIPLAIGANSFQVFSGREYLGEFNGLNEDGTNKTTLTLKEPVAQAVYGLSYPVYFDLGNVSAIEGSAKRRVSLINFNTYASWGLETGTESTAQLVQLFDPKSVNGLIPHPMDAWTQVRIDDEYVREKRVRVQQTLPYPFEIMGMQIVIEENNSETGV